MEKIIRVTTVPISLSGLLKGQLRYMNQFYEVVGVSSKGVNSLHKVEEQEGIRVIPVEMTRKITPIQDLKALFRLYRIFKKEKPAMVHSHTPKAGTLAMIAAYFANVPHRLHTIAGLPLLEATGNKRKLLNWVEKVTYAFATKVYPNSRGLMDIVLQEKFTSKSKLQVIANGSSNGIDTAHFDPDNIKDEEIRKLKAELGIESEHFVFVFVGRFVADKGVNELIKAFLSLHEDYPDIRILMVGNYEKELDPLEEETVQHLESHPAILNVGWQNDVRPYFAISDVLTFPSYREGFPNVVMQAGAMGIYSIVTNINGCNEIVIPDQNGTIIPVKSISALKDAMYKAYMKRNSITLNKQGYRKLIQSRYEQKLVWQGLREEYQRLLS